MAINNSSDHVERQTMYTLLLFTYIIPLQYYYTQVKLWPPVQTFFGLVCTFHINLHVTKSLSSPSLCQRLLKGKERGELGSARHEVAQKVAPFFFSPSMGVTALFPSHLVPATQARVDCQGSLLQLIK